ncbi:hypothetical protein TSMEX_011544 [Taenia solium]|eukprot:TsM_000913200 transcript=TsM_000913200 gene=TsM_000913200
MLDYLTRVAEVEPMKSQDAETVASTFSTQWICQYEATESAHRDEGLNFDIRLLTDPYCAGDFAASHIGRANFTLLNCFRAPSGAGAAKRPLKSL